MTVVEAGIESQGSRAVADIPTIRIEASRRWALLKIGELWDHRELLYFLIWRDLKVKYKQTVIGCGWAVLQPFITMVVFTFVFSRLAQMPSDGVPYPVFVYTALLPWSYFSHAITRSSDSLVASAGMIKKVYFPRLIIPIAAVVSPLVDFVLAFTILIGMMAWFGIAPTWGVLALPAFVFLALATALAVGLFTSAINVRYRDVGHAIPFLTQIWMFVSPVLYPVNLVPERWRLIYSLNPMAGVIEGFRWALLGKQSPDFYVILISAVAVIALLACGLFYFKRVETRFADVL